MAFLVKNINSPRTTGAAIRSDSPTGTSSTSAAVLRNEQAIVDQWIHVSTPARLVPQTTTDTIFFVHGGRIRVHLLLGEVTVLMPATDAGMSIVSAKLSTANPQVVVGTAVTIASTTTTANLEVGSFIFVEGDGTAFTTNLAGAGVRVNTAASASNRGVWMAPQGEIYLSTTASSVTGQIKWDIWYQPLDEGAFVRGTSAALAAI